MKVKKTFYQIYAEIEKLRRERDIKANMLATCTIFDNKPAAELLAVQFQEIDEKLNRLMRIEVEYEDGEVV